MPWYTGVSQMIQEICESEKNLINIFSKKRLISETQGVDMYKKMFFFDISL